MAKDPVATSKNDDDAEFSRLFWAARKEHNQIRKNATNHDPAHQAAVSFAHDRGWEWAVQLLDVSRRDRTGELDEPLQQLAALESAIPPRWLGLFQFVRGSVYRGRGAYDEAIQANRRALEDPNFDTPGPAWVNIGMAFFGKGEYDAAIEAFYKALNDPKYDTPGNAWNNLGGALRSKGEHDAAIQAFRKALDDPKFDTPCYAWNNLGIALTAKGEYNAAIQAFHKALDDPKLDVPGTAWNNLGIALDIKCEHDAAIEAYRKALDDPRYETPAKVWTNLAQAYNALGNLKQAEEAIKQALASADATGDDHARARAILRQLKSNIETEALSPDDRAMVEKIPSSDHTDELEGGVIAAIQDAGDTQYDKYVAKLNSERDNILSILRGWSSAVTLLEGSERRWRGGGYFLKWQKYGIVIDPGFDFLRNFHDANFHGREIQVVLVSHNHPDHNSDLKDIDDLRYELFKRRGEMKFEPYVLLWDQDTNSATKFGIEKPKHQHEPVVLPSGFPQPINLLNHPAKVPIRVTPFKVNHGSDVPHAMGMVVELLDADGKPVLRIGYTADTGYFEDLHKHLLDCDILIAHISQPSIEELQDASKLKEVHLGYRGTVRLLKDCKPKLALIGEFWAGFTDLRIPLVKGLRQRSGIQAVLPAGLGMHLRLPTLDIECTECKKPTPFSQIKIAPPADNFGNLAYLCPKCMIG